MGDISPDADLDIQPGSNYSRVNAGDTQFSINSSREFKEKITVFEKPNLLEKVSHVYVHSYDWKPDDFLGTEAERTDQLGLIAEDFYTILDRGSPQEINGQDVQMVLWMAVQEMNRQNKKLKIELKEFRSKLE